MKTGPLARRLGLVDAIAIGLGSMIGAGVFSVLAPAASVAGPGLLIGLAIAAVVAYGNATSSAQLAAQYPTSGGTYVYGRRRLGEWPGFVAGWSFVIGKTASCAAMALTFAAYAAPTGWEKLVAVVAVVVLTIVNSLGVTRTASLTKVIVLIVLAVLALVVVASATSGSADFSRLVGGLETQGWYGVLQSGGLLFFAFAGYARIATMGEEVRNPTRTIPRAITTALAITLIVYTTIAVSSLAVLGPERLAAVSAPLSEVAEAGGWMWAGPIIRIGAAAAALGALLALIAGVGRTSLAMARNRDLPGWLAAVHPRFQVPRRAELTLAFVVCILILTLDLRGAIGFSSFGVLLYYLVANISAFTQQPEWRRYPRAFAIVGGAGCIVLVVTLPVFSIIIGVIILMGGIIYRGIRLRFTT